MPTEAQKQDKSIIQKFGIFIGFIFFLNTKKFDKKLVVDKSTYRHERVNTRNDTKIAVDRDEPMDLKFQT